MLRGFFEDVESDMPRYRLLAVDLDGTLLSTRRTISEDDLRALAEAEAAGVRVALVTGRRLPALSPYAARLPLDPFIVANSGAIVKEGRDGPLLRRCLLDLGAAEIVMEVAAAQEMEPVVHDGPDGEGQLILRKSARTLPEMARYLHRSRPEPRWVPEIALVRAPVQIGFTGTVSRIRAFEARLVEEIARREIAVHLARTEYPLEDLALLDVLAVDATKAEGLRFLCAHLGIALADTMAIGDNWNDLDMLEAAGLGVIMGNAAAELRDRGFAATATNDEAGVARAIEAYLLDSAHRREPIAGARSRQAGLGGQKKGG